MVLTAKQNSADCDQRHGIYFNILSLMYVFLTGKVCFFHSDIKLVTHDFEKSNQLEVRNVVSMFIVSEGIFKRE